MREAAQEFVESLGFVYPIVFESGDSEFPYYCGGTCFAVRDNDKLFIVTATHCLIGRTGDPCIMGHDRKVFPIKQSFPVVSKADDAWADITCFTTYSPEHRPMLRSSDYVDLPSHVSRRIDADRLTGLTLKGYPASHTEIEPDTFKILRKPGFYVGLYGGPTSEEHCHYFNVLHPPIDDSNGLSGSPVIKIDYTREAGFFPTLMGIFRGFLTAFFAVGFGFAATFL